VSVCDPMSAPTQCVSIFLLLLFPSASSSLVFLILVVNLMVDLDAFRVQM
jgi:hypothetical protein